MKRNFISIDIEGDFIDSYIYSGTLFLVHSDSKITTHSWEQLISTGLRRHATFTEQIYEFLKDCRRNSHLAQQESIALTLDKGALEDTIQSTLPLDGWPTDLTILSNRFYIASERGVKEYSFDFHAKSIDPNGSFFIWHEYAYKVSANDWHRLAIAAGRNGVVTASPRGGSINSKEDIQTIIEANSNDCEWVGSRLIANSISGPVLATFQKLPKRPENRQFSPEEWSLLNKIKKLPPQLRLVSSGKVNASVLYAWVAGMKLFSLLSNGEITIDSIDDNDETRGETPDLKSTKPFGQPIMSSQRIHAARSGYFGAVVERGDDLSVITEDGTETVSFRPVSWRVFPRSKNYLNHLHVVDADRLSIRAYFTSLKLDESDRYGISTQDVI